MTKLKVLDLFSGIGGFSLGLDRTGGFETVAFCEIEEYPRKVLAKHWPEVPCYEDVTKLTIDILKRDGISVDVITGGFPCQDISVAGKQAGIGGGTRSGLWSEIVRLISELRPQYVLVENVANLLSGPSEQRGGWFGRILGDLAECGYDAEWENIPAAALGAPHRRERVWIVAYPKQRDGEELGLRKTEVLSKINKTPDRFMHVLDYGVGWDIESRILRNRNGVPQGPHRLASLGNAVIPQIPELIGRAILESIKDEK